MSILLTHGYYIEEDKKEAAIMKPYPPLGLLYISGYLKENNVTNWVFDSTFSNKKKQEDYIVQNQPKVIAIYTNLMTKVNVIELVKKLKQDSRFGNPTVFLGGPDITYNCEKYLGTGADFLVLGEGEETTMELYTAILNKEPFSEIQGIAYIEDGVLKKTKPRIRMKNMAAIPLPNREAIPIDKYLNTWKTHHGKSSMTISTQRGCPYTCKWCSTAVYGQSYRRRPANLVVEEMKLLRDRYDPDAIWFVDDVFTVSHKWLKSFHEELRKQDILLPFECITRAERLNPEVLQLLKEAGCFRIWIGAESGSQKIIDAMDRRVDVNVVKSAIQQTNALGMESGTFIMLGYPGEDKKDIEETVQYLKEANPTQFTITIAYPIKGTSLYHEIEDKITAQPNWETSTDRDIDFKRTYPRKFYDYAVKYVVNEVHSSRTKNLWKKTKFKIKSYIHLSLMTLISKS